jgi:hypothetical protein
MPVETQTLPGQITRGQDGDKVVSGWCLIVFESTGAKQPLSEWHGEMAVSPDERASLSNATDGLYLHLQPYGGVFEPWHGPVTVEPVDADLDPVGRRLRLRSAGPLTRTYAPLTETETTDEKS